MKIGLIDNELATRKNHSFPNLAIMKLSTWHKKQGHDVMLINFDMINPISLFAETFDIVYISKVFSDTLTPNFIENLKFIKKGGSGFFYDKAEKLSYEIEQSMPDYSLYKKYKGKYYQDYSIGFVTRGCIRQCPFCINKNYKKVDFVSNPKNFIDENKPYIMLLDDNIAAYKDFEGVFNELNLIGKPFVFKQGIDLRLLTLQKMKTIWDSNYLALNGMKTIHFAFDNIKDYNIIQKNLKLYYENMPYKHNIMFYVLAGFDFSGVYNNLFFLSDIENLLSRIKLLIKYNCDPYIMLHIDSFKSPFYKILLSIKQFFSFPAKLNALSFGESILKDKKTELYSFIKIHFPEYLEMKKNRKMYKTLTNLKNLERDGKN